MSDMDKDDQGGGWRAVNQNGIEIGRGKWSDAQSGEASCEMSELLREHALHLALGVALPGEAGDVTVARAKAYEAYLAGPVVTVAMERAKRG